MAIKLLSLADSIDLPWKALGVKLWYGEYQDTWKDVNVNDITAKAVVCDKVILAFYPEWVIT